MTDRPFMQFYQSDFIGDTLHLTTEQIGAYLLLLAAMWNAGGTLPNDEKRLSRITRVSPKRWHLVRDEVMKFFEIEGENITQKRLRFELNGRTEKLLRFRENGSKGGKAKALKDKDARLAKANDLPWHARPLPEPDIDTSLRSVSKTTPRSELLSALDEQRTAAVIDHRQKIRKPLTAHAAKLLAAKFARCPDPNAAADAMVANGWQGFEPGWLEERANGHARAPPFRSSDSMLAALKRRLEDDDDENGNDAGDHQDPDYPLLGLAAKGQQRE